MKKQVLLTCAVVAMAAGQAQAGEYRLDGEATDPADSVDRGTTRYFSSGRQVSTYASDGSAGTFDRSPGISRGQNITTVFRWWSLHPMQEPAPNADVTRNANCTVNVQAGKNGNASASATAVFTMTGYDGDRTLTREAPATSPPPDVDPNTPFNLLGTETLPPLHQGDGDFINVETFISTSSSITAKGTWTNMPAGPVPSAGATSGDNRIQYTVTITPNYGIVAAIPVAQRYAYAPAR